MREGWETKPLGKVCEIFGRIGFRGYNRTDIVNTPEEGAISLSPSNISNGKLTYEKPTYISWAKYEESPEIKIENNDVLFVKTGSTVGKCAKVENLPHPATINPQFVVLKNIILDNSYLCYYLQSEFFKEQLMKKVTGVAVPTTSQNSLGEMVVSYPIDKKEQLAVVEELDQINALIAIKEKQLRELEELEQTIFHEMFGDPIDNEKGWNVDLLSNLCEVFAGGDKPKNLSDMQSKEFPYPVIANGDGEKGILGYSNSCRVKEDAVTIGARGASIGNCRIVKNGFTPAIRLITLVPKEKLNCYFLYFFVRNMDYRINGVAQAQLTVPNIEKENILVPPIALQLHFAEKMQEIEILKDNLSTVKRDLEELHASRMQYWFD